jgi:hypothetical protein
MEWAQRGYKSGKNLHSLLEWSFLLYICSTTLWWRVTVFQLSTPRMQLRQCVCVIQYFSDDDKAVLNPPPLAPALSSQPPRASIRV